MAEHQTAEMETQREDDQIGSVGWFAVAGFVIMGLLYVLDVADIANSILSPLWTLIVAVVAGVGALLLYAGNDPSA